MSDSTAKLPPRKPAKPYAGFPLFSHGSGMWAKKIRGRLVYFGPWRGDLQGILALEQFNREWPYLKDGRTPPAVDVGDGCTLKVLGNEFLRSKEEKLDAGELSPRTFRDYYKTCAWLLDHFGADRRVDDLQPVDFRGYRSKLAKRLGPASLKNEINRCRIVFNFAHESRLIDKPVHYGQNFDRPSAKVLRKVRNEAGVNLFTREEVLAILDAADPVMRAMTLLGLNCGFGNSDCASLPKSALDLEGGWIDHPRPKTEIPRRVPIWRETVEALKVALDHRPKSADSAGRGLCFLTNRGQPWVRVQTKNGREGPAAAVPIDALAPQFAKLLRKMGINGRKGLGFYTLRRCFETYGGESKDQVAVDQCMGHVDSSMAGVYRQSISDERLLAVVETVRSWLFEEGGAE